MLSSICNTDCFHTTLYMYKVTIQRQIKQHILLVYNLTCPTTANPFLPGTISNPISLPKSGGVVEEDEVYKHES